MSVTAYHLNLRHFVRNMFLYLIILSRYTSEDVSKNQEQKKEKKEKKKVEQTSDFKVNRRASMFSVFFKRRQLTGL